MKASDRYYHFLGFSETRLQKESVRRNEISGATWRASAIANYHIDLSHDEQIKKKKQNKTKQSKKLRTHYGDVVKCLFLYNNDPNDQTQILLSIFKRSSLNQTLFISPSRSSYSFTTEGQCTSFLLM